jgi:hypothetical protein
MAPNPAGTGWTVDYQRPTTFLDAAGHAVAGVEVGFVTARGVHGFVNIPSVRFNADTVRAAIAEQVAKHDAVADLKG